MNQKQNLRNQKINYKIREHSLAKIPYIIVCGKKEVSDKTVTVRKLGSDKQEVGMICSKIKSFKPPEPYKGKGIKEQGQYILRKEGKKK